MVPRYFKIIFYLIFAYLLLIVTKSYAQADIDERHIKVSMRMIGHEVLLNSGDSVSRVLAVEKEIDRYKIQFESDFQFNPEELVATINQIVKETGIAISYLVEVEKCKTKEVIYSYEIGKSTKTDLIPCKTRIQPRACYKMFITILDSGKPMSPLLTDTPQPSNGLSSGKKRVNYFIIVLLIIPLLILIGLFIYFRNKRLKTKIDPDMIIIGEYLFDKKNMALSYENKKTELSSKEADLLFLLYTSENTILERENILKIVWGDEGDYVGRTLDVFISKLRKKLAADSSLKIVNIRGIGYKFVMNNQP